MPQKIRPQCTEGFIKNETSVRNEIKMLEANVHPNVTQFVEEFQIDGKWYIVLEYCGQGDLLSYLEKNGNQSEQFCRDLAFNLINALAQMHKKGMAHRDLKLANILINDDFQFKISDFGLARVQENGFMETFCGTPYAMPPEIFNQEEYNTKCDTWSMGVMLYQILYNRIPFEAKGKSRGVLALKAAVLESEPEYNQENLDLSEKCIDFLKVCFIKNPSNRPDMCQLLEHPWLEQESVNNGANVSLSKSLNEIINKAVQECVSKLIKFHSLIFSEVESHINSFKILFSNNEKENLLFLKIVGSYLEELMRKSIKLVIENEEKGIDLKKIRSLSDQENSLSKLLQSQGRTDEVTTAEDFYEFINFLIFQSENLFGIAKSNKNFQTLISFMFQILSKPSDLIIQIKLKPEFENPLFKELFQQQTNENLLSQINSSMESENTTWDVEYIIEKGQREGNEFELAELVNEFLRIRFENSDAN